MPDDTHLPPSASMNLIPPGLRLSTAAAMRDRETFTKAQVTVLIALAFESGMAWAHRGDVAEVYAGFRDHPLDRKTADDRRAERLAWMEDAYKKSNERLAAGRAVPTPPGSWPTVAHVGRTGHVADQP